MRTRSLTVNCIPDQQDTLSIGPEPLRCLIATPLTKTIHDSYHNLNRPDQVTIFRLRTGHNRLRPHLFKKLRIGQQIFVLCVTGPMTSAHLLQDYPIHANLRQETWREETYLNDKLNGDLAALRRTAAFVRAAGVGSVFSVDKSWGYF